MQRIVLLNLIQKKIRNSELNEKFLKKYNLPKLIIPKIC